MLKFLTATGVEFAAELHDLCHEDLSKLYPTLIHHISITIYDVAPKILPMFDQNLASYAISLFKRDGIQIKTEHHIESLTPGIPGGNGEVDGGCMTLRTKEDGDVGVGMCVWSTGLMMNPFIQKALDDVHTYPTASAIISSSPIPESSLTTSNTTASLTKSASKIPPQQQKWFLKRHPKTGGLIVDSKFRVQLTTPSSKSSSPTEATMSDVFAIGDVSSFAPNPLPATAQVANQEGKWLGKRLNSGDIESKSFSFRNLGVMTYLGGMRAIMQSGGGSEIKG